MVLKWHRKNGVFLPPERCVVRRRWDVRPRPARRCRSHLCQKTVSLFECFPYVRPEPVLIIFGGKEWTKQPIFAHLIAPARQEGVHSTHPCKRKPSRVLVFSLDSMSFPIISPSKKWSDKGSQRIYVFPHLQKSGRTKRRRSYFTVVVTAWLSHLTKRCEEIVRDGRHRVGSTCEKNPSF